MKYLTRCLIFVSLLVLACTKEADPETRSFYLGFTPFPYEKSDEAAKFTYDIQRTHADIINHHFDDGVPWQEALEGKPFHQHILDDWADRKANTLSDHKVYVSVTPLNFQRTGLAPNRGKTDNMALPESWSSYKFNHANVKLAYLNYCKRVIEFFQPDYFNMAIEANLLHVFQPEKWSEYLELHKETYNQLKAAYPALPIFTSISGGYLLPDFFDGNDHVLQRLAALQLLAHSDLYGISFYPYLSNYRANPIPENSFNELFNISTKPLAIAETAYAAESFEFNNGGGLVPIACDVLKQDQYINDLLAACEKRKALFVINYVVRDYDQLWKQMGAPHDVRIAWKDAGLFDETGRPRPALVTWQKYLSRKHQAY